MSKSIATSVTEFRHPKPPASSAARATLLAMAWFIFIEQGLRVLIGTVDTLMVSHIGDNAVAGLSVANQIVMLFIISFAFIAIGSSVVITHHLGAVDREGADRISTTAITTITICQTGEHQLCPHCPIANKPSLPQRFKERFFHTERGYAASQKHPHNAIRCRTFLRMSGVVFLLLQD